MQSTRQYAMKLGFSPQILKNIQISLKIFFSGRRDKHNGANNRFFAILGTRLGKNS
jgi:hypothetical protein